jgi:CBS domain-containing protein
MQIGEICKRDVVTIDASASIVDAARLMRSKHVGDLVVVDSKNAPDRPLGVVTDRDIVIEILAKDVALDSVTIGDVASPRTVTADGNADLLETIKLMSIKGVRRIPVLDSDGRLLGILSAEDVLAVLKDQLMMLVDLSSRRLARERSVRD